MNVFSAVLLWNMLTQCCFRSLRLLFPCPPQVNEVAHRLARLALHSGVDCIWLEEPPTVTFDLLAVESFHRLAMFFGNTSFIHVHFLP